ncbi:MAG: hypothetical protein OQJ96_01160 [Flavobacteriales bacterium]|nr:hypothetical protein [Flavobacteriales bacterium]MCW8911907.1 hypothetical protein [Flavobacteriales bacterium]MCW8937367.1 hypothetical protein [Flavobacteriales bacterium]MCW8941458.1 hypothetical protein [Flavobacteriales bacterium]MCW8968960.1 hypothetical protein [Flavobacteriales bacterium]
MKYSIILLILSILSCSYKGDVYNQQDKNKNVFNFNPFDKNFTIDTSQAKTFGFIKTIYENEESHKYLMETEGYELGFKKFKNSNILRMKELGIYLDTISFSGKPKEEYNKFLQSGEHRKLPFDTVKVDRIMKLFKLDRVKPSNEGWLTYTNLNGEIFYLVFSVWANSDKMETGRTLLYLSEENDLNPMK